MHFGGAAAVLGAVALAAHASAGALHQKQGNLAAKLGAYQKGVGQVACNHQAFLALQLVATTHGSGRGFADVERVACAAFLVGQHHQRFAAADARQPSRLGGGVGVVGDYRAGNQRLAERFEHDAAPELFHHHHALDRAHAQAAVVFGDVEAAQTEFGQFVPGGAVQATGFFSGAAAVKAIALVHPFAHGVAQLLLVVRKIEIHGLVLDVGLYD